MPLILSTDADVKDLEQFNFKKSQAAIISKLDKDEIIPDFNEKNSRPFQF